MTTFNPTEFMNTTYKEANETKFEPIPDPADGEGWEGQVSELKARQFNTRDGETRHVLDVTWAIMAEAVKKATGLDKPQVRQTIWLDLTKDGSALDFSKGKNIQLGRLREAVGQNKAGKNWKPGDLMGRLGKLITKQRPDEDDPEIIYSDVKKVLPL